MPSGLADVDGTAPAAATYIKRLSPELSRLTYNKLVLINAAENINDLRVACSQRAR
jgi:proteic killer suppression protein